MQEVPGEDREAGFFENQVRIVLPDSVGENHKGLQRCLGLFEDYCLVTASVREGIPVQVEVANESGEQLFVSNQAEG